MMGAQKHQTLPGPDVPKRVKEIENRQKIFEDEIIKRIKEIQKYTKSIHLQVKKQQQAQQDLEEHVETMQPKKPQTVPDTGLISAQISDLKSQFVAHQEHLSRLQEDLSLKQQLLKQ